MRVLLVSDLHFEFQQDGGRGLTALLDPADVLICAGDLSNSQGVIAALRVLCEKYAHVVYVAGNHEFYDGAIPMVRRQISELATELPQLHYLHNSTCEIDGVEFVGTTLWYQERVVEQSYPSGRLMRGWSDFSYIRNGRADIFRENEEAMAFLEAAVKPSSIVITHMLPSVKCVHPKYAGVNSNCFFVCNVEPIIQRVQPRLWCHGHTHESIDVKIGETRVLCNPFGYARVETNRAFRSDCLIEV